MTNHGFGCLGRPSCVNWIFNCAGFPQGAAFSRKGAPVKR